MVNVAQIQARRALIDADYPPRAISVRTAIRRGLVAEQWRDNDGYWIAMKAGWQIVGDPSCHQIHEDTKREALRYSVEPCACNDCMESQS